MLRVGVIPHRAVALAKEQSTAGPAVWSAVSKRLEANAAMEQEKLLAAARGAENADDWEAVSITALEIRGMVLAVEELS